MPGTARRSKPFHDYLGKALYLPRKRPRDPRRGDASPSTDRAPSSRPHGIGHHRPPPQSSSTWRQHDLDGDPPPPQHSSAPRAGDPDTAMAGAEDHAPPSTMSTTASLHPASIPPRVSDQEYSDICKAIVAAILKVGEITQVDGSLKPQVDTISLSLIGLLMAVQQRAGVGQIQTTEAHAKNVQKQG